MSTTLIKDQMETCIRLLNEHLEAENRHDIEAIMRTYGQNPVVHINGQVFTDDAGIRRFHERLGFGEGGAFSDLLVVERQRYITDEAVIIEQTLTGRHTGRWQGISATGKSIEVPACTIYTFDEENKLAGERVYFDSALLLKQLGVSS
ncbi:MAG TPA: ester cyclase [Blastocatellia bacterium]|nr:ester cyclase [Blastocatellia bacterium]